MSSFERWMFKIAQQKPTIFIDLWFVIVLPILLLVNYWTGSWFLCAFSLVFAGFVYFIRSKLLVRFRTRDIYMKLTDAHFSKLVAGDELVLADRGNGSLQQVHIILEDIGWDRMQHNIDQAQIELMAEKVKTCRFSI